MTENDIDVGPPEDSQDSQASGDEEQSGDSSISDEPRDGGEAPSAPRLPKSRKAPAWTDPDDASLEISLASSARLRKLRDAPEEDAVKGPEYERRLRRQFVKMNPTPEWAAAAAARRKRRRTEVDADAHANADVNVPGLDGLDALVTSSGGILGRKRRARLDPGVLAIERLRDANQAAQAEGEVTAAQFHPSSQLSMLLVASSDRRIRLFNVRVWLVFSRSFSCALNNKQPFPSRLFSFVFFCTRPCSNIRKIINHRSTDTPTRIYKPFTSPHYPSRTRSSTLPARPSFSPATAPFITHTICNLGQQRGRRAGCGARRL